MKQTKKPRDKILAIIAFAVILAALAFTIIVDPQIEQYNLALQDMHQLQLKLVKMQGDILVKNRIDKIYSQIESLISNNVSDQQKISLFTHQLSRLYSGVPIKIRSVKILPLVNDIFYRKLFIRIDMIGEVGNIIHFINSLEKSPMPMRIEKFDLKAKERTDYVLASFLISKVVANRENITSKEEQNE